MHPDMRPPVNRAMRTLDRSFFRRVVPMSAARILNNRDIEACRSHLMKSKDALDLKKAMTLRPVPGPGPTPSGLKCVLLKTNVNQEDQSSWSEALTELVKDGRVDVIPYTLELNYDFWDYQQIMDAILPEDSLDEVPSGFQAVGHIAHLNLRSQYLPYKSLIATVLLDKNPVIKTVINKTDTVGEESEYRTFSYEVLAGPHDMDVSVREQGCEFRFNYAKVYWNSRLNTEHERLVQLFRPGEAVCDVMAGIGPFAIPAGKKRVFVWANDLNPDSFKHLEQNVKLNHVASFVEPFNTDGREFIERATRGLWMAERSVTLPPRKVSRTSKERTAPVVIPQPKTFSHFVMNLPASAITFLPAFIGLYARVGIPRSEPRPCIHVYCFVKKVDENVDEAEEVRKTISGLHGFSFTLGDEAEEGQLKITDVRNVGPSKTMFCASFILPEDVAYRET